MSKEEIFEMMFTNGLSMMKEGKENGDDEMVMVGNAISASVAAAKGGDLNELAYALSIFMTMVHHKRGIKSELTEFGFRSSCSASSPLDKNFNPSKN